MRESFPTRTTNPFAAPTAQQWIEQNAPQAPAPPFPFVLPRPAEQKKVSPSTLEQLYGPQSEPLLGDVVDDPEFMPEHQQLAWSILAGDKSLKSLEGEDKTLLDEISYQMAGVKPKGHKSLVSPKLKSKFDEDTSFDLEEDQDFDPDQNFSPSDADQRG